MNIDIFEKAFESNGVKFSSVIRRLETELKWNTLIFELYKNRLSINVEEIEDQLKLMQNKKKTYEYLISEIIIRPVTTEKLKSKIEELKKEIEIKGFEKAAIDLSIAETALKGGNLGWINENVLTKKFKSIIINTPVGKISEPILLPQGILLFKVRDKKQLDESQTLEETKKKIVDAEKTKILNMFSLSHYDKLRRTISINYY
jgi:peptidyl-prolyl cis-trans isomerase SurA